MTNLILIDNRVNNSDEIVSSLLPNTEYIIFDYFNDTYESLKNLLLNKSYSSICIAQHNYNLYYLSFLFKMQNMNLLNIINNDPQLNTWQPFIEFLLWFGVLIILVKTRAKWWVWVIFIIGTLLALMKDKK